MVDKVNITEKFVEKKMQQKNKLSEALRRNLQRRKAAKRAKGSLDNNDENQEL
jgi:hypothetical protein